MFATARNNDHNGKVLLAHNLNVFDWSTLYKMPTSEVMATYFTQVMTSMLDHLPQRVSLRHSNDKPWVTYEFRRIIRCRQHALKTGNDGHYRCLRNTVNRASKRLRKRHYERKIRGLRECNSANWWRETKRFTGH